MNANPSPRCLLAVLLLALPAAGRPQSPGDLLPTPVEEGDFTAVISTSPFNRVLNISETYALRGIAELGSIPFATLYNRENKKTILITPEGGQMESDDPGIKLVQIVPARSLDGVAAKISFAGEEVELKYEVSQISPAGGGQGSGGGDRKGDGKPRKGPSKEDVDRFRSLPEEKQKKLREYIGHVMKSYPNMSRTEKGNLIRGAMQKLVDGREIEIPATDSGAQSSDGSKGGR